MFTDDEMNQFITEADLSNDALINYNEYSKQLFEKRNSFDEKWKTEKWKNIMKKK